MQPGALRSNTVAQTQSYMKDALLTVARHICDASTCLTNTIELQAAELEGVDATVCSSLSGRHRLSAACLSPCE